LIEKTSPPFLNIIPKLSGKWVKLRGGLHLNYLGPAE